MRRLTLTTIVAVTLFVSTHPARAQSELQRFERQMEQVRRDTTLGPEDTDVPPEQRALIDYGAFVSFNYLSLDDPRLDNHVLRQYDFFPYVRFNLDGASELFLRGRVGWRDFNEGDSFDGRGDERIDPDLDVGYLKLDLTRLLAGDRDIGDANLTVKLGRDYVYWANGLTLSQVLDGVMVDATWRGWGVGLIGGVTPVRTVDIDSSRPDFDHHTEREFYGAILSKQLGRHRPFVYALKQNDSNDGNNLSTEGGVNTRFGYDSAYVGVGSVGTITDRLLYGVEAVYETGENFSNSFAIAGPTIVQIEQTRDDINAWAADVRLDYLLNDRRQSRLSGEFIVSSGDDDRFSHTTNTFGGNLPNTEDESFNAFGLLNTGVAFAPTVSNVMVFRVGATTFPLRDVRRFERLQAGVDLLFFAKTDKDAPIDEETFDERYLGWEPDVFINWQITSDVTIALRYGVFFPGDAIVFDDEPRHYIGAGVTYAF
jgi:hypothetical protein